MEFQTVVEQRRAVRQFLARPVATEQIESIIGTAVLAPSAINLQPWSFAAITNSERINDHGRRAKAHLIENPDSLGLTAELLAMLKDSKFEMFYHAPALLLVIAKSDDSQAREDCCLAAQTLMLAARNAGLGTCWIGLGRPWFNLPDTKRELQLPDDCHVVAPIVMGYPREWPQPHGRAKPTVYWRS